MDKMQKVTSLVFKRDRKALVKHLKKEHTEAKNLSSAMRFLNKLYYS